MSRDHFDTASATVRPTGRDGLTLVEMLVAVTASLLLLGTVMTLFQLVGEAVSQSRMLGILDRQLCAVRTALLVDLAGTTAARDERGLLVASPLYRGYFSIVEGPNNDFEEYLPANDTWFDRTSPDPGPTPDSDDRIVGDTDDMLFFTTDTITTVPFTGRYGVATERASVAEVAYYCRPTAGETNPQLYTLYRRQILVVDRQLNAPFAGGRTNFVTPNWNGWADFLRLYDVSVRREGADGTPTTNKFVLNSVDDLGRRLNRLGHDWLVNAAVGQTRPADGVWPLRVAPNTALTLTGNREGEEELVRNVLSFDIRVLDPHVRIRRSGNGVIDLQPGDPGYWTREAEPAADPPTARFVDLGYDLDAAGNPSNTPFSGYGNANAANPVIALSLVPSDRRGSRTYDTWHPAHGRPPPYTEQLPAVSITVRLYDRSTRRIRQSAVVHSFGQN